MAPIRERAAGSASSAGVAARGIEPRAVSALDHAAAAAPARPGVYFLLAGDGELLYIGKAGDLRRRLAQHARGAASGATARDSLRGDLVVEVRWEPHPSESSAGAREADLIAALRPALNAAHAEGRRWRYVVTSHDAAGTIRLHLTSEVTGRGRFYGCFPHLGPGLGSVRGTACSDGYTALLRLVWAAGEPDERARYPAAVTRGSPPDDVTLPLDEELGAGLHRLLSGVSAKVLAELWRRAQHRPAFALPALERDTVAARGFFDHGPRPLRQLRLRRGGGPGSVAPETLVAWFTEDLTASIGPFVSPAPPRGRSRGGVSPSWTGRRGGLTPRGRGAAPEA